MTVSPVRQIALGLVLNVTAWIVAWSGPEPARYHTFFPLWLGYIIVIDGLIRATTGTSLIQRLRFRIIWLFVISMPIWWLFEAANTRLDNWTYVVPRDYSWLWRHIEASISFSTVVPAIFVTSELVRAHLIRGRVRWLRIAPTDDLLSLIAVCGAALFAATMVWPQTVHSRLSGSVSSWLSIHSWNCWAAAPSIVKSESGGGTPCWCSLSPRSFAVFSGSSGTSGRNRSGRTTFDMRIGCVFLRCRPWDSADISLSGWRFTPW